MLWRIPRRRGAGLAREASGADCAPPWRPASPGRRHWHALPPICCIRAAPPRRESPQTGDLPPAGVSLTSNVPIMAVP
ncbi:hypothetical protein BSIN_1213 [Burkholderia singularis]|uniref:Uncharacterized protein n=1 Tax=Burkholderia singularis TaxID=1503053 RepID=A0A238HCA6_9BURK|nr:hypothetical protein BSIN_1213 [Burkholderia singularis]